MWKMNLQALILAGGRGKRMLPYTSVIPKPLMPINDKPILEYILQSFKSQGIKDITISLGYGADLVKTYCKSRKWKVKFIYEKEPLGTAGPLQLLKPKKTILSINGDILTDLNFVDMYKFHVEKKALLTVAYKEVGYPLNIGTLDIDKFTEWVTDIKEKPITTYNINCGIYMVDPCCITYRGYKDFPQLISELCDFKCLSVSGYKIPGKWEAIEDIISLEKKNNLK